MSRIEELRKRAEAAKQAAGMAALSPEEGEEAKVLAEIEAAEEATRAAEKTRRLLDLDARVAKARAAAGGKYLVRGVDLEEVAEGAGTWVIRSAGGDPKRIEAIDRFQRELEAKQCKHSDLYTDLALDFTVDPNVEDREAGGKARRILEQFPLAANSIGNEVLALNGLAQKERKRGR